MDTMQKNSGKTETRDRLDLLLIYPPWAVIRKRGILQNSLPALGLLSIVGSCLAKGYAAEILDIHAERLNDQDVIQTLLEKQPRFVGISVLTNMVIPAHYIARLCKQTIPDCRVIVGGVHAETLPDQMLRNPAIDAVVRGDGEETMVEILDGVPFAAVLGLSYRERGNVVHNSPRPVKMDLDAYPMPAYHLVDFRRYFPAVGSYRRHPAINMLMTRGCPGQCTFCNSAFTKLRSHSAETIVQWIETLRYQYGIRQIQFYDDTFTVARKRVLRFCELLIRKRIDISWTAYIRGDCFSEDMAEAMKKSGCHQVIIGIESGDDRILENIRKPINKEKYRRAVQTAQRNGIEVRGSFIIGNVGETRDTMQSTLDFAKELDIDLFQLSILTPYPGTQVFNFAVENGLLLHRNWDDYGQGSVVMRTPGLEAREIYEFERYAFRSFYLKPKQIVRQLKRVTSYRHVRDLLLGLYAMVMGELIYKQPDWECWSRHAEDDFLELDIPQPSNPRLTYKLRQDETILTEAVSVHTQTAIDSRG